MTTLLAILGWLLFGLVVGALARFLVPGRQTMSFLMTSLLGIIGSFAGGGLSLLLFDTGVYAPSGWIMSIVGAVIVLAVGVALTKNSEARI